MSPLENNNFELRLQEKSRNVFSARYPADSWYDKHMDGPWYYDLWQNRRSQDPAILFPKWSKQESLAVLSPHDDDALLGAGFAILAAHALRIPVSVIIVCDGCAGYSHPGQKSNIVQVRRLETLEAYSGIGLLPENIHRFDVPDFSSGARICWRLPGNEQGIIVDLIRILRERRVTRFFIPNGHREHLDHEAVNDLGRYASSQTGDPILVDVAAPFAVRSVHVYSVWGDFPPASTANAQPRPGANKAIVVPESWEVKIRDSIRAFCSQGSIIEDLMAGRENRRCHLGFLELYLDLDPRPELDYRPYVEAIRRIGS